VLTIGGVKIGKNLRQVREDRLMTQQELAEAAQLGLSTVLRIENDQVEPRFSTIRKLAKALGVDARELTKKESQKMAKRRGNGEGSISKRKDGRWWGRYTAYTANGPKQRAVYGKTRSEVAEKLTKAMSDRDGGLVFDVDNLKLSDYLDRWLPNIHSTVRQRTWERYEQIARVHLKPTLGRIKLKNLTPTHARGLYRERLESGSAPRTVQYIHTTLRKALQDAVSDGLVTRNVAAGIKAPRPKKKEIYPLNPSEAKTLLQATRGDRLEALYVLAIHCGLRQGELLGL